MFQRVSLGRDRALALPFQAADPKRSNGLHVAERIAAYIFVEEPALTLIQHRNPSTADRITNRRNQRGSRPEHNAVSESEPEVRQKRIFVRKTTAFVQVVVQTPWRTAVGN